MPPKFPELLTRVIPAVMLRILAEVAVLVRVLNPAPEVADELRDYRLVATIDDIEVRAKPK